MLRRVLCGGVIVKMTGRDCVRPIRADLDVRGSAGYSPQLERLSPLTPLYGVPGRRGSFHSIEIEMKFGIHVLSAQTLQLIDHRLSTVVVTNLKIGIFEEVQGMHFMVQEMQVH